MSKASPQGAFETIDRPVKGSTSKQSRPSHRDCLTVPPSVVAAVTELRCCRVGGVGDGLDTIDCVCRPRPTVLLCKMKPRRRVLAQTERDREQQLGASADAANRLCLFAAKFIVDCMTASRRPSRSHTPQQSQAPRRSLSGEIFDFEAPSLISAEPFFSRSLALGSRTLCACVCAAADIWNRRRHLQRIIAPDPPTKDVRPATPS